jgi:hypothetical protein
MSLANFCLRPHIWVSFGVATFILVNLIFFLPSHISYPLRLRSAQSIYQCGNSPEEARSNGCHFDLMSFSWLPPACFDGELMDEFLTHSNWEWYSDISQKNTVPANEVQHGQHDALYVSWDYHFVHCTYMWQKMHRALLHQRPMDGYIGNMHHTAHCADLLLSQADMRTTGKMTVVFAKYPSCGEDPRLMADENHHGWYRVENGTRVFTMPGGPPNDYGHHH